MFTRTHRTLKHLELVRNVLYAVPQHAEQLVVHRTPLQHLHQLLVGQKIVNRILQTLYLVKRTFPQNKLQIH